MNIKQPMVLDTAYNNEGTDWHPCKDMVAAVLCKATEGPVIQDVEFPSTWRQLDELNIPRAAYHFYRGYSKPQSQANNFYDYVMANGGLKQGDKVVLDLEEDDMDISKILETAQAIRQKFNMWPILYSRKSLLDPLDFSGLSASQKADILNMLVWIAGYLDNPDPYGSVPGFYVPNQTRYGRVVIWQYAADVEDHHIPGIQGDLDFDWIDPDFLQEWKAEYLPEEPEPELEPHLDNEQSLFGDAAKLRDYSLAIDGRNVTYHIIEADVDKFDVCIDRAVNVCYTNKFLADNHLQIAINGLDGWYVDHPRHNPVTKIQGFAASKGHTFGKLGPEQTLFISKEKKFSLVKPAQVWDACSFPNLLIKDGQIQPITKLPSDIRARTALGVNKEQTKLYLLVADGGDYWVKEGMSFQDVSKVMLKLGCDLAVMSDGGGSTTMVIEDAAGQPQIVGAPSGEDACVIGGQNVCLRPVAIHFGLKKT